MSNVNTVGCGCSGTPNNVGIDGQLLFDVEVSQYLVPLTASDGTRNGLDLTAPDLGAALLALVNNTDPTKRWYPIHELSNVTKEKADPTYDTNDAGERFKTLDGIKTKQYEIWGISNQFYAKIKDVCFGFGVIEVDSCGSIKGAKDTKDGTMLYPRRVNNYSYNSDFMDKTNSTVSKAMVQFDYKRIDGDDKLWLVPSTEFGTNNPLELQGMLDVNITLTPLSNTSLQVNCSFDYGTALALNPFIGAVQADFTVKNLASGASDPAISGVVPDPLIDGQYVITIAAPLPTLGEPVRVDIFRAATGITVNGYEGSSNVEDSL